MSDSALTIVQDFCGRMGLPVPTAVVGVTEKSVVQYRLILKEMVQALSQKNWQTQKLRATWTSVATESQGKIETLLPGFRALVPLSVWDETLKRPLFGPVGDASWEQLKAFTNVGPMYQYWISNGQFLTNPPLPAGHTIGCIYHTLYGVYDNDTAAAKPAVTKDTDTFLFPDVVLAKEFSWRWKKIKGEPWQDEYNEALDLISKNLSNETMPILQLDNSAQQLRPGIWVPAGNWGTI